MEKKIILFGGTFDPIHIGHTTVAASAAEQIRAEKVVFIPAKRSPHKELFPTVTAEARLKMISLAIAGNRKFTLSDYELKRADPSYTLDTVKSFQAEYGSDYSIYFLVGADMLKDLDKWYKIEELIDGCNLAVMYRAGFERPCFCGFESVLGTQRVKKLRANVISTPLIEISGTEIRRKLASGAEVVTMLDEKVLAYIKENGLYT